MRFPCRTILALASLLLGHISTVAGTGHTRILEYQMVTLEKKFIPLGDSLPTGAGVLFQYPEFIGGAEERILAVLNNFVSDRWTHSLGGENNPSSIDSLASVRLASYRRLDVDDRRQMIGWNENRYVSVVYNRSSVLSLHFSWWVFTGGVHPNARTQYVNFDTETGDTISLGDILIPRYEDSLNAVGERVFRTVRGISPDVSIARCGYHFADGRFSLNDNFAITPEGLHFYFNEYEIAGYAAAGTSVLIQYDDILELIRPDGLLALVVE